MPEQATGHHHMHNTNITKEQKRRAHREEAIARADAYNAVYFPRFTYSQTRSTN